MQFTKGQKKELARLSASVLLTAAALISSRLLNKEGVVFSILLFLPAFAIAGYPTLKRAFLGVFRGQLFDENVLMSIASVCALCLGECFEAVMIVIFAGVGELFEHSALERARTRVESLARLCPDEACVLRDGKQSLISVSDIEIGDVCVIRAGERIPADGVIIQGSTGIDCSAITGESRPVDLIEGDSVSSGCICLDGAVMIRATQRAEDSRAARIIEMIEDSALRKSSAEKFITKFSLRYTPCVVVCALLMALLFPIFGIAHWRDALYGALCFLVISCPCALVISVPLTFFGAIGGASSRGILIKSNGTLEKMARTGTVVLDKTGTLTTGVFGVSQIHALGCSDKELLEYALALEKNSTHPISRSLTEYAKKCGAVLKEEPRDIREYRGKGIEGLYCQRRLLAGNEKLLEENGISVPDHIKRSSSFSAVYIADDEGLLGYVFLCDTPKADGKTAVEELKRAGCRVVMLTGDSPDSAALAASELGITEYESSLLPEDKVRITEVLISQSKTKKESLVFVGDGINDAPALTLADVGIAMGGTGADITVESADVLVLNDGVMKIPEAIALSRRAVKIARQNIIFSLGVKFAVLLLSAFGLCGMIGAVFADVGVSVIAVINAMRTLKNN